MNLNSLSDVFCSQIAADLSVANPASATECLPWQYACEPSYTCASHSCTVFKYYCTGQYTCFVNFICDIFACYSYTHTCPSFSCRATYTHC